MFNPIKCMERREDFYFLYCSNNLYYQFSKNLVIGEQCAGITKMPKMNGKLSSIIFYEVQNLSQSLITLLIRNFCIFKQFYSQSRDPGISRENRPKIPGRRDTHLAPGLRTLWVIHKWLHMKIYAINAMFG